MLFNHWRFIVRLLLFEMLPCHWKFIICSYLVCCSVIGNAYFVLVWNVALLWEIHNMFISGLLFCHLSTILGLFVFSVLFCFGKIIVCLFIFRMLFCCWKIHASLIMFVMLTCRGKREYECSFECSRPVLTYMFTSGILIYYLNIQSVRSFLECHTLSVLVCHLKLMVRLFVFAMWFCFWKPIVRVFIFGMLCYHWNILCVCPYLKCKCVVGNRNLMFFRMFCSIPTCMFLFGILIYYLNSQYVRSFFECHMLFVLVCL